MGNKWDERFVTLADFISNWSKDPVRKVGCVLARGNEVLSMGYNGFPKGMDDNERLHDKEYKNRFVLHAEENAILTSTVSLTGATAYIWPLYPCSRCAAKLVQVGISRVVSKVPSAYHYERYRMDEVRSMFEECGIDFHLLQESTNDD